MNRNSKCQMPKFKFKNWFSYLDSYLVLDSCFRRNDEQANMVSFPWKRESRAKESQIFLAGIKISFGIVG